MSRFRSVVAVVAMVAPLSSMTLAEPGDLDPSFGIGGTVVASVGPHDERGQAVVLQPDGKIVVGGMLHDGSQGFALLARFNQDGTFDTTFGNSGSVTLAHGIQASISALVLQPDGKIVAAGTTFTATENDILLVRYHSDGSLDPSFGVGGIVVSGTGPGHGAVYEMLRQPDGKILVAGQASDTTIMFALARFESDGNADSAFGVGGEVFTDVGPFGDAAFAMALQPDGKIVLAGNTFGGTAVVRYEADGALDPTFGTGGIVSGGQPVYTSEVAVQPDGKIVVGGADDDDLSAASDLNFKLRRLNPDGSQDLTFNGGAVVTTAFGPMDDQPQSILLQPSGRIVLAGYTTTSTLFSAQFAVARYEADGSPDATFGNGGMVTTALSGFARDIAYAMVLQPDSKIIVVGDRFFPPDGNFALARYFGNECGDTIIEGGETCDDGNAADGDCCSAVCALDAAATPCTNDSDACTTDLCDGFGACVYSNIDCRLCEVCDSAIGCVGRPRSGCAGPGPNGQASLVVKDRTLDAADVVRVGWRSPVVAGDFGDPTSTDDYALCVYEGPQEALWLAREAPAGDFCAGRPCWTALGQPPLARGARYFDSNRTPHGISTLVLTRNPRTRLKLKARGYLLELPAPGSLDLPVRVQIQRAGNACWEATFDTPNVNTSADFEATVR